MKWCLVCCSILGAVPASGCRSADGGRGRTAEAAIESVFTELGIESCRGEIDRTDPNETPYQVCPGVEGYALNVRLVDAGRQSLEVVDPSQRVFPLDFQEYVTRHMSTLGRRAEWRVATKDGKRVPLALVVRVEAREDEDEPERVTRTFVAVAKITPDGACVTDREPEGARPADELLRAADAAASRPCVPPLPPVGSDGMIAAP